MAHTLNLIRPDLGKKAYRLRCAFTMPAYPRADFLAKAKVEAAELFVEDMAKQGFAYRDEHGFRMSGPYVPTKVGSIPKRHEQERWHQASRDMLPSLLNGNPPRVKDPGYVFAPLTLQTSDLWEYRLAGVFVHDTIVVEYPEEHELIKELASR
jgi:hypothetical protein